MRLITSVEAFPIRLPRNFSGAVGTAGSPSVLGTRAGAYRWSESVSTLYSEHIESALVKVTLSDGNYGWGEAQAPLAPRVASIIVEDLLAPVLQGMEFDGDPAEIHRLWRRMYQTMRVRGQTGGFMLDAISGVDIALWDLAGKLACQPIARLIAGPDAKTAVTAYQSGLPGKGIEERVEYARRQFDEGSRVLKVFFEGYEDETLALLDSLAECLPNSAIALDALWRLEWPAVEAFLRQLERRRLYWLECPFPPDEWEQHLRLRERFHLPVALGESYRTARELLRFFDHDLTRFVQPDLGRTGITETLHIAECARERGVGVVPKSASRWDRRLRPPSTPPRRSPTPCSANTIRTSSWFPTATSLNHSSSETPCTRFRKRRDLASKFERPNSIAIA